MLVSRTEIEIHEAFTYTFDDGMTVTWDIYLAEIAASHVPRAHGWVDRDVMAKIVAANKPDPAYFDKVDPSKPGLAASLLNAEGKRCHVLIDGNHRCGRALRDGLQFQVIMLSDAASRSAIVACSDWSRIP